MSPARPPTEAPLHVEGVTYQSKMIRCGKKTCRKGCTRGVPSHGPYWYAVYWDAKQGKTRSIYVGKELPRIDELADLPDRKR